VSWEEPFTPAPTLQGKRADVSGRVPEFEEVSGLGALQ